MSVNKSSVLDAVQARKKGADFEETVLPHLNAAYNLARWLTGDDQDAQDVVQEAYLRAFKFFDGYHGGDSRAWLLTIVRNTAYTWLRQNRMHEIPTEFEDELPDTESLSLEGAFLQEVDYKLLREAIAALPVEYREVIILHELEGLAYKEIAAIANIPMGTVMSRLSRARGRLQKHLCVREEGES
jgi:RNA polymerase sigma-70 factor, ECF subfamily